ncbi:MAG: XrtA-associated tyrosine autokinase [Porticoccaceae bacterium]|nr:XrtA-associated tyrosine autokinase [Pseudomonadales bacterium]MCP5172690.1 AAA family ATPase [Pseudomonadales bacterium]MCP5302164.1 AAA family ATPase [Pseudomonadales bacterium]
MSTIEKAVEKLGKKSSGKPKNPDAVDDFIADDFRAEPAPASFVDDAVAIRPDAAQGRVNNKEIIELPLSRLAELGVITPDKPRTQIAEEYRAIKRPLLRNIAGEGAGAIENPNLIMVTSSLEGEGKTFSAVNLMMSMSMESNKTVLFVDADVAKASSSRMLGVSDDAPGLIDVLQHDEIGIEDVLLQSNIPNIRLIPAGHVNDRATELLASDRMLRLMEELSSRYPDRIIIFDSPPLLQTSEANVLANLMGQIVFVVEAEKTAKDAVAQAVGQISDDKVVGMVLNKARQYPWDTHLYGRGYGYGYGYGSDRVRAGEDRS